MVTNRAIIGQNRHFRSKYRLFKLFSLYIYYKCIKELLKNYFNSINLFKDIKKNL